jgi:hypothetical protein
MVVIERVDHSQRSGQGKFHLAGRFRSQEVGILDVYRLLMCDRANYNWDIGVIAVPDTHLLCLPEINALKVLDEGGNKMPARLLTVADDIDAGVLLVTKDQPHRITLAFSQGITFELP